MTDAERSIRDAVALLESTHDALPRDSAARVAILRALDALDAALIALPPPR